MTTVKPSSEEIWEDVWVPNTCLMCYGFCNIRVRRINGVAVKIEGDPTGPRNQGRVCAKGNSGLMNLYSPDRLKTPLKRTNPEKGIGVDPKWVEISWEEAMGTICDKLKKLRDKDPRGLVHTTFDFMTSSSSSNRAPIKG